MTALMALLLRKQRLSIEANLVDPTGYDLQPSTVIDVAGDFELVGFKYHRLRTGRVEQHHSDFCAVLLPLIAQHSFLKSPVTKDNQVGTNTLPGSSRETRSSHIIWHVDLRILWTRFCRAILLLRDCTCVQIIAASNQRRARDIARVMSSTSI